MGYRSLVLLGEHGLIVDRAAALSDTEPAEWTAFVLSGDGLVATSVPGGSERWSVAGTPRSDGGVHRRL